MNSLLIKITFVETCDLSCPYRQHAVFPASWTNHVIFPVWLFFFKLSVNPGLIINAIVFNSNVWNYFILDPRLFFFFFILCFLSFSGYPFKWTHEFTKSRLQSILLVLTYYTVTFMTIFIQKITMFKRISFYYMHAV